MAMKFLKILALVCCIPLFSGAGIAHKFYVSTTIVEYAKKKESLQIITKIFIDDLENVLRKRYQNSDISLATTKETEAYADLAKSYILKKLHFKVNGKEIEPEYLGREYDIDIMSAYLEIKDVSTLKSLEIENEVLFDMFDDQQNIIHLKTPQTNRSFILEKSKPKEMLNFK